MKKLTKYNRVAGYLNTIYDKLNADFFNGEMERPVITIQSTPRAFGHFTVYDAWTIDTQGIKEINIGAGTLARPIENVIATLLHEMCHQYNALHGIKDVSRGNTYHNKNFKQTAETRGLQVSQDETYGWMITNPNETLIDWILLNELTDIPMNRNEFSAVWVGGNNGGRADGGEAEPPRKSSYRKYICPVCRLIARTTKDARLICGECETQMERGA